MSDTPPATVGQLPNLARSKGWLIFFGIFSILVGIFAIAFPVAMSLAIEQVIGILFVITGVFSIGGALFGHETSHRISSVLLAFIRIAAGLALLVWIGAGLAALTILLLAFFLAEGAVFIFSAFSARHQKGWIWLLLNGIVALILAAMIWSQFPAASAWIIGLLYGINSIFYGAALLLFGASVAKPA
jgi:uncharacterized membrane protein HdeD (DUF308 family)